MLKSWPLTLGGPDLNMFLDFWGLGSQGFIPRPPAALHILSSTVPSTRCTQLVLKYLLLTTHFLTSGDFQMQRLPSHKHTTGTRTTVWTNCLGLL